MPFSPGRSSTYYVFQTILQVQGYRLVVTRLKTHRTYAATDIGHSVYNKINLCNWVAALGDGEQVRTQTTPPGDRKGNELEKKTINFLRTEIHQLKDFSCENNINKTFSFFLIGANDIILVDNLWGVSQD